MVKGFGSNNHIGDFIQICAAVDNGDNVSGSDANGGGSGAIGRTNHGCSAGCEYKINLLHQFAGALYAYIFCLNGKDQIFRCAVHFQGFPDPVGYECVGLCCLGVGGKNDGISALDSGDGLEDRCCFSVCNRNDSTDDAHGLSIFANTGLFIHLYEANGFLALHVSVAALDLGVDFAYLVSDYTHAGLGD